MPSYLPLILGSAAIGALVSSIITFAGQFLERRARKRELLLSRAIELAELHNKLIMDAANAGGKRGTFYPYIVQVRWFYKQLDQLYKTGKI